MYACRRLLQALEARMLAMLDLVGIKYLVERWSVEPHTHSRTAFIPQIEPAGSKPAFNTKSSIVSLSLRLRSTAVMTVAH